MLSHNPILRHTALSHNSSESVRPFRTKIKKSESASTLVSDPEDSRPPPLDSPKPMSEVLHHPSEFGMNLSPMEQFHPLLKNTDCKWKGSTHILEVDPILPFGNLWPLGHCPFANFGILLQP